MSRWMTLFWDAVSSPADSFSRRATIASVSICLYIGMVMCSPLYICLICAQSRCFIRVLPTPARFERIRRASELKMLHFEELMRSQRRPYWKWIPREEKYQVDWSNIHMILLQNLNIARTKARTDARASNWTCIHNVGTHFFFVGVFRNWLKIFQGASFGDFLVAHTCVPNKKVTLGWLP